MIKREITARDIIIQALSKLEDGPWLVDQKKVDELTEHLQSRLDAVLDGMNKLESNEYI